MQFYVLAYKKCIIQLFQCKKHIFFLMGALEKNKKKPTNICYSYDYLSKYYKKYNMSLFINNAFEGHPLTVIFRPGFPLLC